MSTIYFAYGSNMDFNRLRDRKISFEFLGKAILHDYVLRFNKIASQKDGIGYANIVYQENEIVEGLLFKVENIEKLDKYEGYPNHYIKCILAVLLKDEPIEAIVYVAHSNRTADNLKPEREYLNRILTAKEYLSESYFYNLRSTPTFD